MDQIISFQSYSVCTCEWREVCSCRYSLLGFPRGLFLAPPVSSIQAPFDYINGKPWVLLPLLCWWHTNLPFLPLFLELSKFYKLVTTKFLTEDLMGIMEGPSCRVGVCERRVSVWEGEPMSKISVLLWFSFKMFEDNQSEILL